MTLQEKLSGSNIPEAPLAKFKGATPSSPEWCRQLDLEPDEQLQTIVEDASDAWPAIEKARCKVIFLYGEESTVIDSSVLATQKRHSPANTTFAGIPEAGHHVMLDQPFTVTSAIQNLMSTWLNP